MSETKNNGKQIVNLRTLKRVGVIGLIVSAAAIVLVAVFSLLQQSGKSFTVRFDDPKDAPQLILSEKYDGSNEGTYFSGDPVSKAYEVDGVEVFKYIENLGTLDNLSASQNMPQYNSDGTETGYGLAQIYTIYLTATGDESEDINVSLILDRFQGPTNNAVSPLEYYRVMLITSDVTSSLESNVNLKSTVYANKNIHNVPTALSDDDYRECVGSYKNTTNDSGRSVRLADSDYGINGQDYCEPFDSLNESEALVRTSVHIEAHKTLRLTFAGYFEGYDPDSYGVTPAESYLLMSLHFGK